MNTRRQSLRTSLLSVAGVLLAFAAAVNAFINVPHLREDMIEIQVRPTLLQAISLGLYFGAFAMAGLALVVLAAAVESARTGSGNRTLLAIVSAVFLAFGATAIVSGDCEPSHAGIRGRGRARRRCGGAVRTGTGRRHRCRTVGHGARAASRAGFSRSVSRREAARRPRAP